MPTLQELYPWIPINTLSTPSINQLETVNQLPVSPAVGSFNPTTDYQYVLNEYYYDQNTGQLGLMGNTPSGDPVQVPLSPNAQSVILGADTWSDQLTDTMGLSGIEKPKDNNLMMFLLLLMLMDEK